MSANPFGDNVRIVDRRKVNFNDIDKHIEMQDGDAMTKILAKLPLSKIKETQENAVKRGDFGTADRARAVEAIRRSGVPPELVTDGQLHEVTSFDPRLGRAQTEYFGDSRVWRSQFERQAVPGVFPSPQSFEKIEGTVSHAGHETLIARSPDGSERVVHVKRDPR